MAENPKENQTEKQEKRKRDSMWYPVVYMFSVTFVLAFILVGLNSVTRERVEKNREVMFERAVLSAVMPDEFSMQSPPGTVHAAFRERIKPPTDGSAPAYRFYENNTLAGYALPVEGQGFWDTIKGVIGFQPDKKTVISIAFHQQSETPGLGGEIIKPYFRKRFEGLETSESAPAVELAPKGTAAEGNRVHSITGATQTSKKLEIIINNAVADWRETEGDND